MNADRFQKKQKKKDKNLLNGTVDENSPKPTIIDRYNEKETKGDFKNSMVKTVVETIGGGVIAPLISALFGKTSPVAGVLIAFIGNYIGDKTGLLRGIAMATMAHGVAKSKEYREEDTTIKKRVNGLIDDTLRTLMLKNTQSSNLNNVPTNKVELSDNKEIVLSSISHVQNLSENSEVKEKINLEEPEKQSELEKWIIENDKHLLNQNSNTSKRKKDPDDKKDDPWGDDVDFSRF